MDGDFDYSRLSRTQLEEALTRIDKGRYPINYQRILKELEVRPPESPAAPAEAKQSVLNLITWYSLGLVVAYVLAYFWAGFVAMMVLAVLHPKDVASPEAIPPLIGSLISVAAPLVLYLHLARKQPGKFLLVAAGVAIAASFLCTVISYIFSDTKLPKPGTVFVATLILNFTMASLVGTLSGLRQLKPPANNRWRGP
jgi:hypothetical protein